MIAKTTLNAKNLEALGAARLAALLIEVTKGDATARRRLRLELASDDSPSALEKEIRKRLASIGKGRSFIDWQKRSSFVADLVAQRQAIETLARADLRAALDLLWRFLDLADSVFERTDDGSGRIAAVFADAMAALGPIAEAARARPEALADQVFRAIRGNDYGQHDGIVETLAPQLGERGLARLSELLDDWAKEPPDRFPQHREIKVRVAKQAIAEARGDVDGFIAQYGERARKAPAIAADIARRLLAAGRIEEAWEAVEAAEHRPAPGPFDLEDLDELLDGPAERPAAATFAWQEARLAVMEAMGRNDEAQAFRWACFAAHLTPVHLKAYLKRLPDFDDIEAERRAFEHAAAYPNVHPALAFFIVWPALPEAEALIRARSGELDGNHYELLTPAAEALAARHPLAATLCLCAP